MESNIKIREFHFPDDYPAALLLWKQAGSGIQLHSSDEHEEIKKKLQRDPDLFLVAEMDGQMIGTVIGGFDGRRGMVYHLTVIASHRQQGAGSLLMDELEKRLGLKGCIRCYMLVTTENETAMRFYEQRGWERMKSVFAYGKDFRI